MHDSNLVIHINRSKPLWSIELMGDRFYESQAKSSRSQKSAPRKLKAEWIKEIGTELGISVSGLDKCTIDTLTNLLEAIKNVKKI